MHPEHTRDSHLRGETVRPGLWIGFSNQPFASHIEHRGVPTINLVTCFPFYFVGDAPQRYVLHCSFRNKTSAARERRLRRRATALGMTPAQRVAAWSGCMPLNRGLCFKLRL